jgi:hypothetical protein
MNKQMLLQRQTPKSATQKSFNMSFRILSMQGKVATDGAKIFVNSARLLNNIEKNLASRTVQTSFSISDYLM